MMNSEQRSGQPDTSPPPCANGCGFYGSVATLNLCSKCHKQHLAKEEALRKSIPKSQNSPKHELVSVSSVVDSGLPTSSSNNSWVDVKANDSDDNVDKKNRCFCCNKKVGLTGGFKCRCGSSFCSKHRYPETHHCTFDFKALGRDSLTKANPIVKADKIVRF